MSFSFSCASPGFLLAVVALLITSGCDAPIDSFEANRVLVKRLEIAEEIDLSQPSNDAQLVLTELFGTPNDPRWPTELLGQDGDLVDIENLTRAAGAVSSDEKGIHRGLYREHCIVCHGTEGDGLGPAAALLNPYPRDFRLGKVKFKRTPLGSKPIREDLVQILRRGIPGTAMPAFNLLEDEDLEALVDYVIYLSVRGEVERRLLTYAAMQLDLEGEERLYDPELKSTDFDSFEEQWEFIVSDISRVVRAWRDAQDEELVVPKPELLFGQAVDSDAKERLVASVKHGQELFRGNVASCAFCHGSEALGDGQQNNYDDWTRDWTSQAGLNPADEASLQPLLAAGALKPRNIMPRNLRRGIFRGGSSPEELYTRIVNGIEGTPMPAVPLKPSNPQGLTEQDVWDIVNYLLSLSAEKTELQANEEGGQVNG